MGLRDRLRKRGEMKPWETLNLWEMFSTMREMARSAASWDAKIFYWLINCEGSHDLKIEHVDGETVQLSIGGPKLEGESTPCRVSYVWRKTDETVEQRDKRDVMNTLATNYKGEVPEYRQRVNQAGKVLGVPTYIG